MLERPDGDPATRLTVCPGEHHFTTPSETYSAVWWSPEPQVLHLGAQPPFGLRRDDLIVKDVESSVLYAQHREHQRWRTARDEAVARARAPRSTSSP